MHQKISPKVQPMIFTAIFLVYPSVSPDVLTMITLEMHPRTPPGILPQNPS